MAGQLARPAGPAACAGNVLAQALRERQPTTCLATSDWSTSRGWLRKPRTAAISSSSISPAPRRALSGAASRRGIAAFQVKAKLKSEAEKTSEEANEVAEEKQGEMEEEEYEAESWVSEKFEDVKEASEAILAAVPGPRVGSSALPWIVAVPLGYFGLTLIIAVIKTVRRLNSPRAKRRRLVGKNAGLVEAMDELLLIPNLTALDFSTVQRKFGFAADEVLRKYLRFALNEKPFNPDLVAALIRLRTASNLSDEDVAEMLNEISRRTVKAKGPVMMDTSGFTEKGLQRKAAVQALFSKLLYLAELEEFCSSSARDKLDIKAIFGVTDEDADSIRITSLSSSEDLEKLDRALGIDLEGGPSDTDN